MSMPSSFGEARRSAFGAKAAAVNVVIGDASVQPEHRVARH
jgi:hypothetical protein